jgi:C4-dicarboxylate transporter DctM subunit
LIGITLVIVATFISRRKGYAATTSFSVIEVWKNFKRAILALGAPVIILGGILFGIFTATESAAVAVVYALVVGMFVYRKIKVKDLVHLFRDGAITSAIVMFIIATASIFSWFAAIEDLPARLAGTLLGMTANPIMLLLIINFVLLIAGTFVETTAALILLVPMITAMVPSLGIDMVQLGVIVVTNLAIGMLTPPMGICLIVSCSISGDSIVAISKRILPFLAVLIIDLLIITFYSPITMWMAKLVAK